MTENNTETPEDIAAVPDHSDVAIFGERESEVRSYSRNWPEVFDTAKGVRITTESGEQYLDFFGGAGALNYGHNDDDMKAALLEHIERDGITHSLDKFTVAKRRFLQSFSDKILEPRGLDYKVMFPGPTGTNAVESALKLARKVTGRESIISFTNAFHGMTLGSLSVTGNSMKRAGAGIPLVHATPMPFDNYFGGVMEDFAWFERVLDVGCGTGVLAIAAAKTGSPIPVDYGAEEPVLAVRVQEIASIVASVPHTTRWSGQLARHTIATGQSTPWVGVSAATISGSGSSVDSASASDETSG